MASSSDIPKELFLKKQTQRLALKAEYWKQVTNPHRHGSGEGGFVFDPSIQRFMSMKVTGYNFFKPTPKTSLLGLLMFVLPLGTLMYFVKAKRDSQETKFRSGLVSYRDRNFKFI